MTWFLNTVANAVFPVMKTHFASETPITYYAGSDTTGIELTAIVTTLDDTAVNEEDRVLNSSRLNVLLEVLDLYEKPKVNKDTINYNGENYIVRSFKTVADLAYEVLVEKTDIQSIGHGRRGK